jgi:hypothetical protein
MNYPPLQSLHHVTALSQVKLKLYARLTTDQLTQSLAPGHPGSLKTREDGTIIDGNHRIEILRGRGIDVDQLPREIVLKE